MKEAESQIEAMNEERKNIRKRKSKLINKT